MFDFQKYKEIFTAFFITYGARVIVAIIILFIGLWVIKKLVRFIDNAMSERHVDPSLRPFLRNILNISLRIVLIIAVIAQLGMEMTSIFAVLGSAGLAIGLALQGSLANFAGGVLILAVKPFRVGDNIEAQGVSGKVYMINILHTIIKTPENKTIFLPNGPLANTTIINYDMEETRRADLRILIQYHNNIERAKEIVREIISKDARILPEPAPQVVSENTETGVAIVTRVWAEKANLGGIINDLNDKIRAAFQQENIDIYWRPSELTAKK